MTLLVYAAVIAAAGCGRVGFDPTSNANDGALPGGDALSADVADVDVVPDSCPPTTVVVDDFEDGVVSVGPSGTWAGTFQSTVVVFETGGRLVVAFPSSSASASHAGVYSRRYDLTSACALMMTPVLADAGTVAYSYLTIEEPTGTNRSKITLAVAAGMLEIRKETMTGLQIVTMLPFDPLAHLWWRIRTGAGLVVWETSGDRITWTTHHSESAYFDLTTAQVVIGAGTDGASTNAGTTEFDRARIYSQ